jgi:hypothetical protein
MRTIALIRKSVVIIASLAALSLMGGPAPVSAAGTSIAPSSALIWDVQGALFDSGVTISANVNTVQTSILISDRNPLIAGMLIRVDGEYMLIEDLIDGPIHQPDTMVVTRAQNGSFAAAHASGAGIKAQTVNVNIYANDVTDPLGLGSFQIYMVLPPEVQYVQMVYQEGWLTSTGRESMCDGPFNWGGNTWTVSCTTLGATPAGPRGSGLIAKVTLLPSQSVEKINTIKFSGSELLNTHANPIPATVQNLSIKVLKCPDANLDGNINVGDALLVALQSDDRGIDTGATLVSQVNASQTQMQISDQSLLLLNGTASIDAEQMTVQTLQEGMPDTMTVVRGANKTPKTPHNAGAHIYLGTIDGNYDGKFGYTGPRDVNHDGVINVGDSLIIAMTPDSYVCPVP